MKKNEFHEISWNHRRFGLKNTLNLLQNTPSTRKREVIWIESDKITILEQSRKKRKIANNYQIQAKTRIIEQ